MAKITFPFPLWFRSSSCFLLIVSFLKYFVQHISSVFLNWKAVCLPQTIYVRFITFYNCILLELVYFMLLSLFPLQKNPNSLTGTMIDLLLLSRPSHEKLRCCYSTLLNFAFYPTPNRPAFLVSRCFLLLSPCYSILTHSVILASLTKASLTDRKTDVRALL